MNGALYTPESELRRPAALGRAMLSDLFASRTMAWKLAVRNFQAKHRQTALGALWTLVPPVAFAAGAAWARRSGFVNIGETSIPYPAWVLIGMVLWQAFSESLQGPLQAALSAKVLLAKLRFPREAIVLGKTIENLFSMALSWLLVPLTIAYFGLEWHATLALVPLCALQLIVLGTGLGLVLAPLGLLYGDISRGLAIAAGAWLLCTPVLYPISGQGFWTAVLRFNPVTPLLIGARDLALEGTLTDPSAFLFASVLAWAVGLFGWLAYRLLLPVAVERLSA